MNAPRSYGRAFPWLICLSIFGCESTEPEACDPLAMRAAAIQLEEIVAIGRTADGSIIVVDRSADASPSERLFVSDGETLVRQDVIGTGESNAGGKQSLLLTSDDGSVLVEGKGEAARMKYIKGEAARASKVLDFATAPGEELEILDESAVASLSVRNLPGDVEVEYFARVGDERLVVTRPVHDFMPETIRLFFGRPESVAEREIEKFERYRDGGSTKIEFDLDGRSASVFFTNRLQTDGPVITEPVTFEVEGAERAIMRVLPVEDPELEELHFRCL